MWELAESVWSPTSRLEDDELMKNGRASLRAEADLFKRKGGSLTDFSGESLGVV